MSSMDEPSPSASRLLLSLPNELLENVADYLVRDNSLLSLRLVCRELNDRIFPKVLKHCFEERVVHINFAQSLESFDALSRNDIIRQHVKSVRISTAGHIDIDYMHRRRCNRRDILPDSMCADNKEERAWLRSGANAVLLTEAFKRFPNIETFGIAGTSECKRRSFIRAIVKRHVPVDHRFCCTPFLKPSKYNWRWTHSMLMSVLMVSSVNLTTYSAGLEKIDDNGGCDTRIWNRIPDSFIPALAPRVLQLQKLAINVDPILDPSQRVLSDFPALCQLLSLTPNLRDLEIRVCVTCNRSRRRIPDLNSLERALEDVHLPNLQTFKLMSLLDVNCSWPRSMLNSTIGRFSASLRTLSLVGLIIRGSFVPSLQFILDKMQLKRLTLTSIDEHTYEEDRIWTELMRQRFPLVPPPHYWPAGAPIPPPPPPLPRPRRCLFLDNVDFKESVAENIGALIEEISAHHENKLEKDLPSADSEDSDSDDDSSVASRWDLEPFNLNLPPPSREAVSNRLAGPPSTNLRPRHRGRVIRVPPPPPPPPPLVTLHVPPPIPPPPVPHNYIVPPPPPNPHMQLDPALDLSASTRSRTPDIQPSPSPPPGHSPTSSLSSASDFTPVHQFLAPPPNIGHPPPGAINVDALLAGIPPPRRRRRFRR